MDNKVLVAKVVNTKGLRGEVKLKSYTQDLLSVKDYILVDIHNSVYNVQSAYLNKDFVIAKIKGINSKEDANKIIGKDLFVLRKDLPILKNNNSYYIVDLIGLNVLNENKVAIGLVKNIHNFGAGDILEIVLNNTTNLLVPFNHEVIIEVDVGKKVIYLNAIYKEYL